ncbi:MAG: hypothetical protein CMG54_04870 [Candidatus Marinimicrobia bacterium]|nr:hypothetical protein [Candidatus Neomarinimicrobiota bacterium]|tara:strand:- start:28 stop:897 length:870 start_codon:yes stop_codon:yes gene_type:complete
MKFLIKYFTLVLFSFGLSTFSIVAVDIENGIVGSAGASCIGGSIIISDIHPGVGAIHTQSYWSGYNQIMASNMMDLGLTPDEIIDYIVENDVSNNPAIRQYGIVDIYDGGRSAAYTGSNCMDYKDHILGPNYAIQGNILLDENVLLSMEQNFNQTIGTLSDKLMAALQGANIPGADSRCLDNNTSSLSAFIRVAKPLDEEGDYYLDLNINNTSNGVEPIDLLQELYNQWQEEQDPIGDISGDGILDIIDLIIIIDFILEELFDTNADLNFDGGLNIQDIVLILNIILER